MISVNYQLYRKISPALLMVYVIIIMFPKVMSQWYDINILNQKVLPVVWIIFILIMIRFIPKVHPIGQLRKLENLYMESIVSAAALTVIRFLAGSFFGQLGESPYDLSPSGVLGNLFLVLPPLLCREYIRSYILCTFCIKPNLKIFASLTMLFTIMELNYSDLNQTLSLKVLTIFFAEEAGPILCQNIMLSYFALYGGVTAAAIYIGIITLFHWTSPILPVLNWLADGAIGILVPIFALATILKKYETAHKVQRQQELKISEVIKWALTGVVSIGLIWFVVGVFPMVPSVIVTGSMEPMIYPGDIIILKQIQSVEQIENLKKGDVIQFQRDEIRITHRIISVRKDKLGNLSFKTKGDNNSAADSRIVKPNDIKGTLTMVIPKLGYPSLLLKGQSQVDKSEVEF